MLSLTPMLQSADLARAEAWYRENLGFEVAGRAEDWIRLERDGVALMLMRNAHLGAPTATATQYFEVDDVRSLWESLDGRVAAEWGLERMPYGMLEFAVRDADGYLLSFGQRVEAEAPVEG